MISVSGSKASGMRHFLMGLITAALFTAISPAYADNTFLLQLGTSTTEDEANDKWQEIKSRNNDLLAGLTLHIAEVSLPPDHKQSFRTQVGPVSSREKATTLCKTLQDRGISCYVVETILFAGETTPDQPQEDSSHTSASLAELKEIPVTPVRRHVIAPSAEEESHSDDPDYVPPPVDSGPVVISTSEPTPPAPQPASVAEIAQVTPPRATPATTTVAEAEPETAPRTAAVSQYPRTENISALPADRFVPGRAPRSLDSEDNTPPAPVVVPAPAPAPVVQAAVEPEKPAESPGFFSRLFGSAPKPEDAKGVSGSVNVAEAVRVPLSSDNQPPRQKIVPVLPAAHGMGADPADSTAKTLWAQISYFRDEAQALTFYRQFSASNPQYTDGVRIRITRPFATSATAARVSLRVGPFLGTGDVQSLCATANRWNTRCTIVRDLGASIPVERTAAERNKERGLKEVDTGRTYLAQLGSFRSSQDAWDAWKSLKTDHRKLVSRVRPTVTTPPQSSATEASYRLRAGPMSQSAADAFCAKLQAVGAGCAVVNER